MNRLSVSAGILCFALIANLQSSAQDVGVEEYSEIADHMHEHLARITAIKAEIVMGNLQGVREPADWLAEHESVDGLPANFVAYVEMMREYARQVIAAPDLQTAAVAVSSMARTCGNCHLTNHVELEFGYDQMPNGWADTVSHMQRHQWATDRLWEGLIGPSDAAWNRGTDMLVDIPLHPSDVMDDTTSNVSIARIDAMARRIHVLGAQGSNTRTPDSRSGLYAELLGLCANCHTTLNRGPGQ